MRKIGLFAAAAFLLSAGAARAECPVLIFITDWCQHCSNLQSELDDRGVSYSTCDIEASTDCRDALVEVSGSAGVPVTLACGMRIDGNDPDSVEEALGRH